MDLFLFQPHLQKPTLTVALILLSLLSQSTNHYCDFIWICFRSYDLHRNRHSGGTDTVVVVEPINPTTTVTSYGSVSIPTTFTETDTPGGTDTVVVVEPINPTTTVTSYGSVSIPTTFTETDTHGGTDTVVVVEPINPTTTVTSYGSVSIQPPLQKPTLTVALILLSLLSQSIQQLL